MEDRNNRFCKKPMPAGLGPALLLYAPLIGENGGDDARIHTQL
jgi:hypothetical protein